MIRSMTGFGKAVREKDGQQVTIELSAVNHRYLDANLRLPNSWSSLEPELKQFLRKKVARGKICVTVSRRRAAGADVRILFDEETAKQYVSACKDLAGLLGSYETLSVDTLAQLDGVFVHEEPEEDLDAAKELLLAVLADAVESLDQMREVEGDALEADVRKRIDYIKEALSAVEQRLPELNKNYEERLRARINDLKAEVSLTEERIAIEVALLAEKADVTEEVVRLKTHLEHMLELLDSDEPVGRRLDFLLQELQREVNTLGVKTRDNDVSKEVLKMKAEVEKIREQVQNIE